MLLISDLSLNSIAALLGKFKLSVDLMPDDATINGSYWGEPEAGIVGNRVLVRRDTPVHSLLHETCHIVCMTPERRQRFKGDGNAEEIQDVPQ